MPRPSISNAPNPNADPNAKDQFKNLDSDFKDACAASSPEELYKRLSDLAVEEEKLDEAKLNDQDLATAKDAYDTANEPYKLARKEFKLKRKFIVRVLGDQGKA